MIVMALSLVLPLSAFAAGDGSITIEPQPNVSIARADFTAYRIFNMDVSAGGANYAYSQIGTQITDFLALPGMTARYGADVNAFIAWLEGSRTRAEMTQLTADLATGGFTPIAADNPQVGVNVKFSNLDYGYYLVVGQAASIEDPTQRVVAHSSLVTIHPNVPTTGKDAIIRLKADVPTIGKEVSDTSGSGYGDSTTVGIGDTVHFQLTTAVPDMRDYTNYTFIVRDTLGTGLDWPAGFAKSNVSVTVDGAPFTAFDFDVTGKVMTLDFSNATFLALSPADIGKSIVIRYSAVLNADAVRAPASNPNEVTLTYSNNPYTNGTGTSKPEIADVYTLGFEIDKRVNSTSGDPLAGVTFNVHSDTSNAPGALLRFTLRTAGTVTTPAVYVLDPAGSETLTTPASGRISVVGLDEGDYWIVEKTAPAGYTMAPDQKVTLVNTFGAEGESTFAPPVAVVINRTGGILPETGGIGTTVFYVAGSILIFLLVMIGVIYRKEKMSCASGA